MKLLKIALLASSLLAGDAYAASDKPIIAPPPSWVKPSAIPATPAKPDEAAVRILLSDQQVKMEKGRKTLYSAAALRIQTPQGLAVGNLSLPWNPETDELTVHKLAIRRGDQVIDVLASGQTFTVVRREPNLESAMLDGVLTANIQPEGLQVGDTLELAFSIASSDPMLKDHVEQVGAAWNEAPVDRVHFRAQWPAQLPFTMRQTSALPPVKVVRNGDIQSVDLAIDNLQPMVPVKYAPGRYNIGRMIELSDLKAWPDLSALFAPLYAKAAVVPNDGPLRAELDKIKAASTDPVKRTEAALALVQDRVRYVALLMGPGGYVPASAADTWSRRFGDCKGKSALLLALLNELGVTADVVLVNAMGGDGMDARLPMAALFNHVIVRATIAGKTYWLDGTRTGDISLARLRVPAYGWGLPIAERGSQLVRMEAAALDQPDDDLAIHIDARQGLSLPAPFKAEMTLRGDGALATRYNLANLTADARDRALREYWKGKFDFVDPKSVASSFDPATGEQRLTIEGTAKLDWKYGMYEADYVGLGYKADFTRPAGPDQNAPYAVQHPIYSRTVEEIQLPPRFPDNPSDKNEQVNQTAAGIEYRRTTRLANQLFRVEATTRSVAPEFPAIEAPSAEKALRALKDRRVFLPKPHNYAPTQAELDAPLPDSPEKADILLAKGWRLMSEAKIPEAIGLFDQVLGDDPRNAVALALRAAAYLRSDRQDAALKDIDAALAIEPKNNMALSVRADLARARNDSKAAIAAYGEAIAAATGPAKALPLMLRASYQFALGDYAAAMGDTDQLMQILSPSSQVRLLRANIFTKQGKKAEAIGEADLLAANSSDNMALVTAARIYSTHGERVKAFAAYDRALALKPEAYIYINRAQSREKDDVAGQLNDYDAALRLNPESADAIVGKAALLLKKGDAAAAIGTYSIAIAKHPAAVNLLGMRGIAYAKSGDMAKAEQDFATAREKAPNAQWLNMLCWDKATAGVALDAALKDCDLALTKQPGDAETTDSRALVLLRLGRIDEAIAGFDAALAKSPKLPASLYGRAVAWSRKGDMAKAQNDRQAAIAIQPDVEQDYASYGVTFPAAK